MDGSEYELTERQMSVVVGGHEITNRSEPSQTRHRIKWAVIHKLYPANKYQYDIMLLQLKKSIKFNDEVSPICVDDTRFTPDDHCRVTGWGATNATCKYAIVQQCGGV